MTEGQTKTEIGQTKSDLEEDIRETFNLFDKDSSGFICEKELVQAARALGCNPTEPEIKDFMTKMDKDRTHTIDFEEFKDFYSSYKAHHKDEKSEIKNAFKLFDKDDNGFIEAKELRRVLSNLGQRLSDEEITEMIATVDTNEDGKINIDEFTEFICKK